MCLFFTKHIFAFHYFFLLLRRIYLKYVLEVGWHMYMNINKN